jgi:hypothetical protein
MKTTTIKSRRLLFVTIIMATFASNTDQVAPNEKTERMKGKAGNLDKRN